MRTVQVSDEVKDIVDRQVATGVAASEADFVEQAVRRYVVDLADDEDELIAAAEEGIAAIQRGDYVAISGPDDLTALRDRVWAHAMALAEEMRAPQAGSGDEVPTDPQAGR